MKELILLGASGHGKVAADIARRNGYDSIRFLDDDGSLTECGGYPVIGKCCTFGDYAGWVINRQQYQQSEKKGNEEEIEKLYGILNE